MQLGVCAWIYGDAPLEDTLARIAAAGQRLWHVHLADTNRQALGRGHLDLEAVIEALRAAGYAGAAVLEVMPPGPDPFRSIKDGTSARVLDRYLAESLARLQAWGLGSDITRGISDLPTY